MELTDSMELRNMMSSSEYPPARIFPRFSLPPISTSPARSSPPLRGRIHSILRTSIWYFSSSHMDLYSTVLRKSFSSRQESWLLSQLMSGALPAREKFLSSRGLLLNTAG